jgi:hypothetical protein
MRRSIFLFLTALQAPPALADFVIEPPPPISEEPPRSIREPGRLAIGSDFFMGPLVGPPSLLVELNAIEHLSLTGALRAPLGSSLELALEPRFFLSPHSAVSLYGGLSFAYLRGDINSLAPVLRPRSSPTTESRSARSLGLLMGLQFVNPESQDAIYLGIGYRRLRPGEAPVPTYLPELSVGYRYFF